MATFAAWDDWWVAILEVEHVDLGTSASMPRVRVMGTRYRVRLGYRAATVALVNCDTPGRDRTPDPLEFQWLRPDAAFRFRAVARSWWETLHSVDASADFATIQSEFVRMLVQATAELQRWPGIVIGTSSHDPKPPAGVDWPPPAGALDVGGATHRITGWVDGHVFYTAPDGREFDVTASAELFNTIVSACADHFGVATTSS